MAEWQGTNGQNGLKPAIDSATDTDTSKDNIAKLAASLDTLADQIEAAQNKYNATLMATGITVAVGVGLTVFTFGASDAIAGEAAAVEVTAAAAVAEEAATAATSLFSAIGSFAEQLALRMTINFVLNFSVEMGSQMAANAIVYPDHNPLKHLDPKQAVEDSATAAVGMEATRGLAKLPVISRLPPKLTHVALPGAVSAGSDAAEQELTTGHIDLREVGMAGGSGVCAGGLDVARGAVANRLGGRGGMRSEAVTQERATSREDWREQTSRERAERAVSGLDQPLENPNPSAAQQGHGHARHGYQTTEAEQAMRVRSGIAPDHLQAPATRASRFRSPQAEAEALGRGHSRLNTDLVSGAVPAYTDPPTGSRVYVNPANGQPVRWTIVVATNNPRGFGEAAYVARRVAGPGTPFVLDAAGNRIPERVVAPQMHARITYEYVPSKNQWQPLTYFPEP